MKIGIIGAGIAGLMTAIVLRMKFPDVELELYEQSPELKPVGAGIILSGNAVQIFKKKQNIPESQLRYAGYTCWRGITHPINDMFSKVASETWSIHGRFGIVPLTENKVYWYACVNSKKNNNPVFSSFKIEDLYNQFSGHHEAVLHMLENTATDMVYWNGILDFKPLNQYAYGKILLIGDAAHAMTPNLGQGACQSIEDAWYLGRCITETNNSENAFKQFEKFRVKRCAELVKISFNLGKLAQTENTILVKIRNALVSLTPQFFNERRAFKMLKLRHY